MTDFGVFGEWDAPATDELPRIATPIGEPCAYCSEDIAGGDDGAITPYMGPHHKECALRSVMGGIGHHIDHERYCKGPLGTDAGLSHRDSACLVWCLVVEGMRFTEADLEAARHEP